MVTATFQPLTDPTALYCHYDGQYQQQDCYLQLDLETGVLSADYDGEIGGARPAAVYHNRTLRWGIPCLIATAANTLMEEALPIAQEILDGAEIEWDGNNHVGRLNEDAADAAVRLAELCDDARFSGSDLVSVYDAVDWFEPNGRLSGISDVVDDYGLSATSTDEDLDTITARVEADAGITDGVCIVRGTRNWLSDARAELRDRARADLEQVAQEFTAAKTRRNNLISTLKAAGDSSRDIGPLAGLSHMQAQRIVAGLTAEWWPETGGVMIDGLISPRRTDADEAEADEVLAGLGFARISPWTPPDPEGARHCHTIRKI